MDRPGPLWILKKPYSAEVQEVLDSGGSERILKDWDLREALPKIAFLKHKET
jgi:hypothetical protein